MSALVTAPEQKAQTARSLRTLYLVRTAFSVVWVVLVFALAASVTVDTGPNVAAVVLLVVYPVWDVVATLLDIRANRSAASHLPQYVNLIAGVLAAIAMIVAAFSGLTAALVVFGSWAFVSGAVQLLLALVRRRALGAQWPMIVSGGLSVLAGISFALMAGAPKTGLATLAGYSAFGAFWYLVAALLLIRSVRTARSVASA